jgi:hypothetical protein
MRINRFLEIYAGYTLEDIAEGRFAYLTDCTEDDVYGVRVPTTDAQALKASVCVSWPPTNIDPPYYTPTPSMSWALRKGFDRPANDPSDVEVSMVYPGFRDSSTIPSGTYVRLLPYHSVVTLTSGNFIDSASYARGARVSISYSGTSAGKPQYDASGTIAQVEDYDSAALTLTLRVL